MQICYSKIYSLVQAVQVKDSYFTKKVTSLHRGEHPALFTANQMSRVDALRHETTQQKLSLHSPDHLQNAVGDDKHLSGHLALAANQIARCKNVSFHFEHEIM